MFQKFLVFSALAAIALAAVADHKDVPIISMESDIDPSGKYHYHYETGDGTKAAQDGEQKLIDKESGNVARGEFSYTGDDGKAYRMTYVADENGYQPQGEHLPVAPEIPAMIARALDWIAAHPSKE